MNFITTSGGNYPRIGDTGDLQVLRRTIDKWEKGKKTDKDLAGAQQEMTRRAVEEQIEAGIDLVTDGQIAWYDPVSHLVRGAENVEIRGLLRFYDTNFYFRQPEIGGRVTWKGPVLVDEFTFAKGISSKPVKPVLTGPYTIAALSILKNIALDEAARDLAEFIAFEVEALAAAGASVIQIDEPEILRRPDDFPILLETLRTIAAKKAGARIMLATYWGDAAPCYDRFQELPVDILGFDLTYGPRLPEVIGSAGSSGDLSLGVVDARNTRMEKATEIARTVEKTLSGTKDGTLYLSSSCGLEYLPRDRARDKLELLADVKRVLTK